MGCVLSRIEHWVWSSFYDRAANKAANREFLSSLKEDFISILDGVLPKDLDSIYDQNSGNLIMFRGVAPDDSTFTIRLLMQENRMTLEFD